MILTRFKEAGGNIGRSITEGAHSIESKLIINSLEKKDDRIGMIFEMVRSYWSVSDVMERMPDVSARELLIFGDQS